MNQNEVYTKLRQIFDKGTDDENSVYDVDMFIYDVKHTDWGDLSNCDNVAEFQAGVILFIRDDFVFDYFNAEAMVVISVELMDWVNKEIFKEM